MLAASIADTAMPPRIARLPRDQRGFPVPWFVAWLQDGKRVDPGRGIPDFRIIDTDKFRPAIDRRLCWICGDKLGVFLAFPIGPMSVVSRVTSEPPCHKPCGEYAMRACPFLANPRMRRNPTPFPVATIQAPAGEHIERNPGVMAIYMARDYRPFVAEQGQPGILLEIGPPLTVDWYREGRPATRQEAEAAIDSGLSLLEESTRRQHGEAGERDLAVMIREARKLLPRR